ncbi:hypothetical protein ACX0GZ_05940 [Sphingomonas aestuarii]
MTKPKAGKANALESDNAVFFLVALLKIFARVYDEMKDITEVGAKGRQQFEEVVEIGAETIETALINNADMLKSILEDNNQRIAFRTSELLVATGELQAARTQLETTVRDAKEAFAAFEHLKGDVDEPSLSRLFQDRMTAALDKRVPVYDQVFRAQLLETIALGMGRYFLLVQFEIVIIVAVLGFLIYYF